MRSHCASVRAILTVMQTSGRQRPLPPDGSVVVAEGQIRASDLAESYLRSLIFSGRLSPGDKLPSERELAAQFGIARITLRAALRSLETIGFLVVKIGSKGGAWIADPDTLTRRWEEWMQAHKPEVVQMLEFRRFVETEIAKLAAERRTAEDLEMLERVEHATEDDRTAVVRWHFDFHDALAKAAHNEYLEKAMVAVRGELFVPVDWAMTHTRIVTIEGVHDRILDAVRAGDAERAVAEMNAHLDFSEEPFRAALGQ
ncbi:MAG: FCD domain-containing protein [Actinomycetia bacterium]|nr:FCD domain-containing protein [Actinomycetes bacterium]